MQRRAHYAYAKNTCLMDIYMNKNGVLPWKQWNYNEYFIEVLQVLLDTFIHGQKSVNRTWSTSTKILPPSLQNFRSQLIILTENVPFEYDGRDGYWGDGRDGCPRCRSVIDE